MNPKLFMQNASVESSRTVDVAKMLRRKPAAARIGSSIRKLDGLKADGKIPAYKIGGSVWFHPADLDAFVAGCRIN